MMPSSKPPAPSCRMPLPRICTRRTGQKRQRPDNAIRAIAVRARDTRIGQCGMAVLETALGPKKAEAGKGGSLAHPVCCTAEADRGGRAALRYEVRHLPHTHMGEGWGGGGVPVRRRVHGRDPPIREHGGSRYRVECGGRARGNGRQRAQTERVLRSFEAYLPKAGGAARGGPSNRSGWR